MNTMYFDFSVCPCGEQSAIQPSKLASSDAHPQSSETDSGSIFVACPKCKRLYSFGTDYLVSLPTPQGFGPYNPEAPIRVFRVFMKCDELNCEARLLVLVMLNASTTDEQLRKEMATWNWSDSYLRCDFGHPQPYPPWR
jgi:hypothetical protein